MPGPRVRRWGGRTGRRLALALVVTGLSLAASPGRAAAHAGLESSIPAASATLQEAPADIVLDFDEPIEASISTIELFDADARSVEVGDPEPSQGDDSIVVAALPDLDEGIYAVVWRVGSADGHIVDGAFSFRIGTGGSGVADDLIDEVRSGAQAGPSVDRTADVARLLGFVGLTVVVGAGLFAAMSPRRLTDRRATSVLLIGGWVVLMIGTLASFGLYGAEAVAGDLGDAFSPEVWGQVAETRNGWLLLVRSVLVLAIGAVTWLGLRRPPVRATSWWQAGAVGLAIAIILTYPSSGHPSAESPRSLWVLIDGVHLGAAVVWLGGQVLFAAGGAAWFTDDGERTVRRFSAVATVLVPIVVVTGSVQTFRLAGDLDDFTETGWGRTLLVKLSIVVVLLAIAGVSRWLLRNVGLLSLRRTIVAEACVGVVVLAVAASLVSQPPQPIDQGSVFSASLAQAGVLVDVTLTPGRVGPNEVHLVVTPPGGSLTPVTDATARMKLPSRSLPASPVTIEQDGANHYTGAITLPFDGDWTLEIVIEVSPGNSVLMTTTVPIP
ncbi:MAG: copper resistance protein CopC [Actinobacteria bacterium]|nr:copper resistance protein CopC [Actinomycetota bacterium]